MGFYLVLYFFFIEIFNYKLIIKYHDPTEPPEPLNPLIHFDPRPHISTMSTIVGWEWERGKGVGAKGGNSNRVLPYFYPQMWAKEVRSCS